MWIRPSMPGSSSTECTVVGDVRDGTGDLLADRVLGGNAIPRIRLELLHAERDAVGFLVDANDLNLDLLADGQDFRRMVDAAPCHVGHVQQAVDAAEVNERTVVGDVLDDAVNNLAFFEVLNDFQNAARRATLPEPYDAKPRCCRDACPS